MDINSSPLYQTAIALLARREHSCKELQQKLQQRYPEHRGDIAEVLIQLQQQNYQNDSRFTEAYLRARLNKGFGLNRIRQELHAKGINEALASTCIQNLTTENNPQRIYNTWLKKFKTPPKTPQEKHKQMQFLRYRGFSQGDIHGFFQALPGLWGQE